MTSQATIPPHKEVDMPSRLLSILDVISLMEKSILVNKTTEPIEGKNLKKTSMFSLEGELGNLSILLLLYTAVAGGLYTLVGETYPLKIHVFGFYIVIVSALLGGYAVGMLRIPRLIGMLLMGIALRNLPFLHVYDMLSKPTATALRKLCIVVSLSRCGVGLNGDTLRSLGSEVFSLAFIPCLAETCIIGLVSHYLLDLPKDWGFMLGFVMCAASTAIIIPGLLNCKKQILGVANHIPDLGIAAASIDTVVALTGFNAVLQIALPSTNDKYFQILKGPFGLLSGIVYGALFGFIISHIPSKFNSNSGVLKFILLMSLNTASFFGSALVGMPVSGPSACVILAFTATQKWKHDPESMATVKNGLEHLWYVMEPCLFGLLGTKVDLQSLNFDFLWRGILLVVIGVIIKMTWAYITVLPTNLNHKERLFMAITWLPKATVQAAIGSTALEIIQLKELGGEYPRYGMTVATLAALVTLITAPLGYLLIKLSSPRLLSRGKSSLVNIITP